ncbi:MAG: AbrB/MazE/SpoVT family DNA-binding domain-containing protein [Rhodospirillum sp.]|nr:AbrB/MazE/SpoVT family DNA-binding domain-containing protein [Rhodospirillum sp.]MCF8490744.1 AbrB/MazE/SpoVT family DNA-binding domain-containing protein [Rhodospirillum sp.]MCF8502310.1 AbrB/MazE/SpoVT family DNA-binding domain-containing protein [Rhodospirillum sp.]
MNVEDEVRLAKWCNRLAVFLPAGVAEALDLKEGDEIEIHAADARNFNNTGRTGCDDLLKRLRAFRGRLLRDFKFDRREANAR